MLFIAEQVEPLYQIKDKRAALQAAADADNDYLSIVCHPQGPKLDYWSVAELAAYPLLPNGVEVFNGHYSVGDWRLNGGGWDYTQFWADCLDAGLRLHAYANDDYHDGAVDLMNGWNVALVADCSPSSVLQALRSGACYATTGLTVQSINEYKGNIVVSCDQEVQGRFVGPQNKTIQAGRGRVFSYQHQGEAFIRFEAEANGKQLWTQPTYARAEPVVVTAPET